LLLTKLGWIDLRRLPQPQRSYLATQVLHKQISTRVEQYFQELQSTSVPDSDSKLSRFLYTSGYVAVRQLLQRSKTAYDAWAAATVSQVVRENAVEDIDDINAYNIVDTPAPLIDINPPSVFHIIENPQFINILAFMPMRTHDE
jgi:hypothetical protein